MKNLKRNSAWLYDIEQDNDNLTDDIPFYIDYAASQKGEVLELGCGTGRVALALLGRGFHVTALDLSKDMLDVFREKLSKRPELEGRAQLVHASMSDFSFDKKFALIIVPFRAFQAVTQEKDIQGTLACVREHLSEGGIFIVNVFKPYTVFDEGWCRDVETVDFEVFDENSGLYVVRKHGRPRIDVENQIVYPYLAYEITYEDGRKERVVDQLELKYYYSPQLREVVEKAGFEITDEYSWYDKSPPGGREIILVCKKRQ